MLCLLLLLQKNSFHKHSQTKQNQTNTRFAKSTRAGKSARNRRQSASSRIRRPPVPSTPTPLWWLCALTSSKVSVAARLANTFIRRSIWSVSSRSKSLIIALLPRLRPQPRPPPPTQQWFLTPTTICPT